MRRSSRLESATTEKRKTKMSMRLAEHAKRQRREMANANAEEDVEEGEMVDRGDDSDFIASSEEEGEEDDDEEEEAYEEDEDEQEVPRPPRRGKRKAAASITIDSSDSESSAKPIPKIKSILKRQSDAAEHKKLPPKSILKRPKTQSSADSSPNGKADPKPSADAAGDTHRRPVKQRATGDAATSASGSTNGMIETRSDRSSFGSSLTRPSRGGLKNTLTQFFIDILEWDFHDALMRQARKQDHSAVTVANDGSEEGEVEITRVPSKFESYEHYFSVWQPLALEEVQAQTLNSIFTDRVQAIPIEAAGSGNKGNFLDRTTKIRIDAQKVAIPATQRRLREEVGSIFANDLVLLTPHRSYFDKAYKIHNSGGGGHADSKSEASDSEREKEREGFLGIVATQRGSREGVTITVLSTDWRQYEPRKKELFVFKLNNLVTSVREFRALCDCENYQLMPLLLSGEYRAGSMQLDSLGLGYVSWLRKAFNESQLEAITAAATSEGFTLIKGPPGTGKTTTLKGLLNSLHLREYNRYYNAVLDVARRPDHETNRAWARIGNEKPHILVTAPSNAAVDNIIGKIIAEGFCDGEGRKYFPKIVRVGRGMGSNVRVVGLDDMVDQICGQTYDVLQHKLIGLHHEIRKVEHDSIMLRNRFREVVAAIDQDPVGILAREIQQEQQRIKQEQQKQQEKQLQQQQPAPPDAPLSPPPPAPPPAPPVDSPPPPGVQFTPSAPSPPPSFAIHSPPPPNMFLYPSSPPPYAISPTSPPAPQSPVYGYGGSSGPYSFGDDDEGDEAEEEDEAFPTTYGPPATSPASVQEASPAYNAAATSRAYSAFFDDSDDDGMNAEEDEPLPNAVPKAQSAITAAAEGAASDRDEEDEAFPPLVADPPPAPPEPVVNGDLHPEEGDAKPAPSPPADSTEKVKPDLTENVKPPPPAPAEPAENENHDENSGRATPTQELDAKVGLLRVNVDEYPSTAALPMSPPPPPPPMSPPPPPPMSPPMSPPPPPPDSPIPDSDEEAPADSLRKAPAIHEPIIYERYLQYRVVAQQLNSCLERLSELRLEENRYNFAMKAVSDNGRPGPQLRQSLEVSFLDTAHIVFTTLSSAGVTALDASTKYDVLVVDEAAQAVELSSIIPMKFGSRQCVLVGDPQQLSATVFSRSSDVSLYERSLFERLETTDHPVHMLRTQYRSHPLISDFPRHYFYDGKLQDADTVKTAAYDRPYHRLGAGAFTPLVFWNLLSSRETTRSMSRLNAGEAEMAVNLYLTLKNSCPPDAVAGKVGVITPYSQQNDELKNRFRRALGDGFESEVEINTVDGFQGREKDIIILSTVRADPQAGVGFLNDTRRMNVSLTRAKYACYVIGSEATLRSSKPWRALMDHAYEHQCIVHVQDPKCNLLTLRPMEMPSGGGNWHGGGGGRRGGGGGGKKGGFQHPPHVQIPPQSSQGNHHQPSHGSFGANGGRRISPTGAPPNYGQDRGPSPTNQAWRGGRGRGGGRDPRRDPRLNGRGGGRAGRGNNYNGGRGADAGGPPGRPEHYADRGPPQQYNQLPVQHHAPGANASFRQPPPLASQPAPHMHAPPHGGGRPSQQQQHYPARVPPAMAAPPIFQAPPAPQHFHHAPPPQHAPYQGPPPSASYGGPPPQHFAPPGGFGPPPQHLVPPPQNSHDGGRGAYGGRVRDPRLLRQQGRGGGGRSYGPP